LEASHRQDTAHWDDVRAALEAAARAREEAAYADRADGERRLAAQRDEFTTRLGAVEEERDSLRAALASIESALAATTTALRAEHARDLAEQRVHPYLGPYLTPI
jgi:hypothetical protein